MWKPHPSLSRCVGAGDDLLMSLEELVGETELIAQPPNSLDTTATMCPGDLPSGDTPLSNVDTGLDDNARVMHYLFGQLEWVAGSM